MDGKLRGKEMYNNKLPNTQPQETISSHLSPTIQCGGPSQQRASRAGESQHSLISQKRRRKRRSFKGLRSFPLPPGSGRKIKCLHSVSPALFQMPPLPFKRPLWAWMANERFWVFAIYSFLSLPFSIPHSICDVKPKSLLYFYSLCESAETDI